MLSSLLMDGYFACLIIQANPTLNIGNKDIELKCPITRFGFNMRPQWNQIFWLVVDQGHPIADPLVLIQCFSYQGLVVVLTSGMRVIGLIGPCRLYGDIFGIASRSIETFEITDQGIAQ